MTPEQALTMVEGSETDRLIHVEVLKRPGAGPIPRYSKDSTTAVEMLQQATGDHGWTAMLTVSGGVYRAHVGLSGGWEEMKVSAPTFALAVCRAVLVEFYTDSE